VVIIRSNKNKNNVHICMLLTKYTMNNRLCTGAEKKTGYKWLIQERWGHFLAYYKTNDLQILWNPKINIYFTSEIVNELAIFFVPIPWIFPGDVKIERVRPRFKIWLAWFISGHQRKIDTKFKQQKRKVMITIHIY